VVYEVAVVPAVLHMSAEPMAYNDIVDADEHDNTVLYYDDTRLEAQEDCSGTSHGASS